MKKQVRGKEYMKDEKNRQFLHRISRKNVGLHPPPPPKPTGLDLPQPLGWSAKKKKHILNFDPTRWSNWDTIVGYAKKLSSIGGERRRDRGSKRIPFLKKKKKTFFCFFQRIKMT